MLVPDALQGVMTDTQIELPNETACAEGGQGFAELHALRFAGEGSSVRLAVASPRMFVKTGRSVLLKAAQPLAHGGNRGGEEPSGVCDAALMRIFDEPKNGDVGVVHT